MKIVNVTPEEFERLHRASRNSLNMDGTLNEAEWVTQARMVVCELEEYQTYRVVVRRDVPSIPWDIAGVRRIEDAPA